MVRSRDKPRSELHSCRESQYRVSCSVGEMKHSRPTLEGGSSESCSDSGSSSLDSDFEEDRRQKRKCTYLEGLAQKPYRIARDIRRTKTLPNC